MKDPPDMGTDPPIIYDKTKKLTILSDGPKFLVVKRIDNNKTNDTTSNKNTLSSVSPFLIKKVIDNTCGGEVEICKKLRNGTLLIKTKNFSQANKLIQLCSFSHTIKVEVTEHNSLNFVCGVIYSNDLRGVSEEEILSELKNQNVYKINKILKRNDNYLIETGLIIVTFATTNLPSDLLIGYEKLRIRPYIPLPLKCKNRLRYGHHFNSCVNSKLCNMCSNNFHTDLENNDCCAHPESCINCIENHKASTNHSPNSKNCPIFLKEKEIQAIVTLEKVSRSTAVKIYYQRNPTMQNYASIMKPTSTKSFTSTSNNNSNQTIDKNGKISMATSTTSHLSRPIINYQDSIKTTDISDEETSSFSSQGSTSLTPTNENKINILPRKTSKRQRKLLKKQLDTSKVNKRVKKE